MKKSDEMRQLLNRLDEAQGEGKVKNQIGKTIVDKSSVKRQNKKKWDFFNRDGKESPVGSDEKSVFDEVNSFIEEVKSFGDTVKDYKGHTDRYYREKDPNWKGRKYRWDDETKKREKELFPERFPKEEDELEEVAPLAMAGAALARGAATKAGMSGVKKAAATYAGKKAGDKISKKLDIEESLEKRWRRLNETR